jgi:hypothetical protein
MEDTHASEIPLRYMCVIAIFDQIEAMDKHREINIKYEYIAMDSLRLYDENTNILTWQINIQKKMTDINDINIKLILRNTKNIEGVNFDSETDKAKIDNIGNDTQVTWHYDIIKAQEVKDTTIKFTVHDSSIHFRMIVFIVYLE